MNYDQGKGRLRDDDSLLASFAGVPLTRMARVGLCLVWAGFWAARLLLTDVMTYINPIDVQSAFSELLGQGSVDQGFSVCMIWLTIEVAVIAWSTTKTGVFMLIAKTPKSWSALLLERLPTDRLKAELERREKAEIEQVAKVKGKEG